MHEHHDDHEPGHDDHGVHGSHDVAKYLYVFGALTVLTGASFFTYSRFWPFRDTPAVGWTFMMAVSCTKALLVMLFFMHLKYEASWKYVLTIPASVMAIFLILALVPDIKWRIVEIAGGRKASEERWLHMYEDDRDAPPNGHGEHDGH